MDFPEPYDEQHPRLPPMLKDAGRSLVTRRVLVMDLCRGKSVSKVRLCVRYIYREKERERERERERESERVRESAREREREGKEGHSNLRISPEL